MLALENARYKMYAKLFEIVSTCRRKQIWLPWNLWSWSVLLGRLISWFCLMKNRPDIFHPILHSTRKQAQALQLPFVLHFFLFGRIPDMRICFVHLEVNLLATVSIIDGITLTKLTFASINFGGGSPWEQFFIHFFGRLLLLCKVFPSIGLRAKFSLCLFRHMDVSER